MPRLGAHMSTAGGAEKALERGQSIGCETIQVFVTGPSQWKTKVVATEEAERFAAAQQATGIAPVVAHARYLLNLGSPDEALWRRSIEAFWEELQNCQQLQIPGIVLHPGAHMGAGEEAGLQRIAAALDELRQRDTNLPVHVLLENTAGQGTVLGHRFEHLARIMEMVQDPSWLGVCFDTCHAFSAGYELRTAEGFQETWAEFERALGLNRLEFVHLNDAKGCLGCHLDRHEQIGKGQLGLEAFRQILNDKRLRGLPMSLETPKGPEMAEDVENLSILRSLITES
ncbi:MAG: deoxyribonuclease IV [Chloroflexi bacterium]|nr:deoxyribonuclease IV [Chloroflexota bacterium]